MKRIALFVLTNLAVVLVLGVAVRMLGLESFLGANGLDLGRLLAFALVLGFGGAFVSLLLSKPLAKWTTGLVRIDASPDPTHVWLTSAVRRAADQAGVRMPEVGLYEGPPNAFATGAFRNSALVAVSTGLVQTLSREEVEAVIAHEVAHVANGDMVTMALLQGVLNTFVVFVSRVVGYLVDKVVLRHQGEGPGVGYVVTTIVLDLVLGVLAALVVAWFSRQREFRADAGAARLLGRRQPMIDALARLGRTAPGELPKAMQALAIHGGPPRLLALFATHPPLAERIERLQRSAS